MLFLNFKSQGHDGRCNYLCPFVDAEAEGGEIRDPGKVFGELRLRKTQDPYFKLKLSPKTQSHRKCN